MRTRITFAKTNAMRYTSNLDVHRAWERTVRRALLPLSYSEGFNPKPKINLADALPLGFTSEGEIVEIWFDKELPIDTIQNQLREASPPGLEIIEIEAIDPKIPKLPNLVAHSKYEVYILDIIPGLSENIQKIIVSKEIFRERRGKKYDLRPLIQSIEYDERESERTQEIRMVLTSKPGKTGRPDEVLAELGIPLSIAKIKRIRIILDEN